MGIPANVVKNVISGLFVGGESWQTTWWDSSTTPPSVDDTSTGLFAATSEFTTMITEFSNFWSSATSATDFDQYGYTGGGAASSHGHASLSVTGAGSAVLPYQCCVVMTLRTGLPGRSYRGRMYWPATGTAISNTTGLLNTGLVNNCVDALATFFGALTGGTAVVVSQTNTTMQEVTSVDADYVPDTQRRRVNKLTSSRHSATV